MALGIVTSHLLLQLLPGNQLVHPFQKDLAACLALFVLALGYGKGHLAHGGGESYAIGDGTIVTNFGELFRGSLAKRKNNEYMKNHYPHATLSSS
jgi:hypothetical protein